MWDEQYAIDSKELQAITGATYRQVDYWASRGIIQQVTEAKGPGYPRLFSKNDVVKVKLLVRVSEIFNRANSPLKHIWDNYEEGAVDLGNGIFLTWDPVEIERDLPR